MTRSERLDQLLIAWHRYQSHEVNGLGFPRECPSCRGAVTSKQWHGTDVDEDGDIYLTSPDPIVSGAGKLMCRFIDTLNHRHQLALAYQARALSIGSYAFRNPRLPSDMVALSLLIAEARGALSLLVGDFLPEGVD